MRTKAAETSKISERRLAARKTAAAEYEKRRARILKAAAEVFKELGYSAATVDDVAKRAKIDRASIYYYFKGKKDLLREMVGGATAENVEMAEAIAASSASPREQLHKLIVDLLVSYERHYPYLYVYVQEDMSRLLQDKSPWSKRMVALNHRFDVAIVKIIQAGLTSGPSNRGAMRS